MNRDEAVQRIHDALYSALKVAARPFRELLEEHDLSVRVKISVTPFVVTEESQPRPHPPADLEPLDCFETTGKKKP